MDQHVLSEEERARLLDSFRQTGLRLDGDGRWWHEGEAVSHRGLTRALNRWIDRLDDGRYIVRLDAERYAYIEVEDAPLIIRTLSVDGKRGRIFVQLSDETTEELDYASLRLGAVNSLYCRVRRGFDARFCRSAYLLVSEMIVERDQGFVLVAADREWPID